MTSPVAEPEGGVAAPLPDEVVEPMVVDAPRSPESIAAGNRLDADHAPETNGWMAVCRRCGIRTDGPLGGHAPYPAQISQADRWLDGQAMNSSIARLKTRRDT
jgi:hypothetical protein